jgi:hypothetical protein
MQGTQRRLQLRANSTFNGTEGRWAYFARMYALLMNLHACTRLKDEEVVITAGGPAKVELCIHHRSAHRHVTRDRSRSQLTRS